MIQICRNYIPNLPGLTKTDIEHKIFTLMCYKIRSPDFHIFVAQCLMHFTTLLSKRNSTQVVKFFVIVDNNIEVTLLLFSVIDYGMIISIAHFIQCNEFFYLYIILISVLALRMAKLEIKLSPYK